MNLRDLSVQSYSMGVTIYSYRASAVDDTLQPEFWNDAWNQFGALDHIHIHANDGGALLQVMWARANEVRVLCLAKATV